MKIVVDMDEVLAEFVQKILRQWNFFNGTGFTKEDITEWRMENILGRDINGHPAEGIIDRWLSEEGFYEDLEPVAGAIEGFQHLVNIGHDVVVATSIPEVAVNAFDGKRKWMRKYFPKWSMKNFFASSRKGLIGGDVLIDDGPHNINDWCREGKTNALLMDNQWNRNVGVELEKNQYFVHGILVERVYDWSDIIRSIEKISKKNHERNR